MRVRTIILVGCAVVAYALVDSISVADSRDRSTASDSEVLRATIQKLHAQATVIPLEDVNTTACGPPKGHPAIVQADFNGDGHADYAVLLRVGDVKRLREAAGKTYQLVEVWFVIFMSKADGTLAGIVLDRFDDDLPLAMVLEIQAPGVIRAHGSYVHAREVRLKNPGVIRVICEKSAAVFYWDEKNKHLAQVFAID